MKDLQNVFCAFLAMIILVFPGKASVDELQFLEEGPSEILWDEWGVPHIYAQNNDDLFYCFGWAQMHSHANTILKIYNFSRGSAAAMWGSKHAESDMLVHALGLPEIAEKWYESQSDEFRGYIDRFVQGMNDYATKNPSSISEENHALLPVQKYDVLRHALFVIYTRFVGGNELGRVANLGELGSNTYAVGPERTVSGNAMLVMNPHLPWFNEFLFYEGHFNTPELNLYGATLIGLPTLGIAFNEFLGWSHTNNTIDNADLYELTLENNGYIVDGQRKDFQVRKKVIGIRQDDGSTEEKELQLLSTPEHGAVIRMGEKKAISIKMPGFDRPYGIVQWWKMGNAKNLNEFQNSLKEVQIPFFNIMYADREGNIFYMFNGQVPKRKKGDWSFWGSLIDGSKSENLWEEIHTYEELPKVVNPASGWLQNANDPPWTSTVPTALNPDDFPPYMAPVRMSFRPQRAVRMLMEDEKISFDEMVEYKLSTRIEMADRFLDDLFEAIEVHGGEDAKEAMSVLKDWDRNADSDSRGMALFYRWAHTISPWNASNYSEKWSFSDPMNAPDGLANPKAAVEALEKVVGQFKQAGIPLNIPWGEVYRIRLGDRELAGNGSDGSVGIFRVAWSNGAEENGKSYISGGDSWQGIIEFGDKVQAKVLMSYGNSTQQESPNYGDQLELFSKKEMRECRFYRPDVLEHVLRREVLVDGVIQSP
jgi:acyl-homoserine-lactone acylase